MTNPRYAISLLISFFIYSILGFLIIYTFETTKKILKPKEKIIKISLIKSIKKVPQIATPIIPIISPKKIIQKHNKKKIIKKVIKKKKAIQKKRIIKKKKILKQKKVIKKNKIIKKRTVKRKVLPPKVLPKKIISKEVTYKVVKNFESISIPKHQKYIPEASKTTTVPTPSKVINVPIKKVQIDNSIARKAFLNQVRKKILHNKKYPKIAVRRHIEGSVRVKFDINTQGNVLNIRFISGKNILQKAVRKAVLKSFPIQISKEIQKQLPINNISITINFLIH